jgi:hypothetical protein
LSGTEKVIEGIDLGMFPEYFGIFVGRWLKLNCAALFAFGVARLLYK